MQNPVISVENISKSYRLGQISTGTFTNDLKVWWAKARGKPNPLLKIGEKDHGNRDGEVVWALKDVSFEVQQGEVLGIIGRNGAGKSTLLKILSQVTAPTSGQIKVKGRVASLLEVGTGFHPELTGRENIYLNGAILGMTKEEVRRKFDEIVAFAEVEKFIDTPVKRYSSGMYVRLAFAVAAHLEPEILVVDEVLAVGDAEFQKKCLGKMGDVANEGRTVLFVSHNMAAVKYLCKEGLLISEGEISEIGEINKVVDGYLMASQENGCNFVDGQYDLSKQRNQINPDIPSMVTRMELINDLGVHISKFRMGSSLNIVLHLNGYYSKSLRALGIIFKTPSDQWITSFTTGMKCIYLDVNRSQYEAATLKIDNIRLTPGDYFIDISITQEKVGRIQYIENSAKISIVEDDYFGTGFNFTPHLGVTFLDGHFEIKNEAN